MVKAGDYYKENLGPIEAELFHSIDYDGNVFRLSQTVKVTTKDGYSIEGEILNISEGSIVVLPVPTPAKLILFDEIEKIEEA